VGEAHHQQRERRGRQRRRAEPLDRAGDDHRGRGRRQPGAQRADAEDGEPGEEHGTPAEEVGGAAAEQQEAAEAERVGADDPLQPVGGEADAGLDVGQGDVHDRDVQHHHELRDGKHRQRQTGPVPHERAPRIVGPSRSF